MCESNDAAYEKSIDNLVMFGMEYGNGSGNNGLVPSGSKPSPESMLT